MVLRPKTRESGSPPGPTGAPEGPGEEAGDHHGSTTPHARTTRRTCPEAAQATGHDAGWSSPVARQAHNLKVAGSNPAPATNSPHSFSGLVDTLPSHARAVPAVS